MRLTWIALALSSILVFSCQVTQEFAGVDHSISIEQFPIDEITTDSSTLGNLSIDEFFKSSELIDLINTGLANNRDLGMAVKSIEIAQSYYLQGRAAYFPTLSAGAQLTYGVLSENTPGGSGDDRGYQGYQLGVNSSWEIDLWGKLKSQEKAAFADYQSAHAGLQAVQTQLISQIASLYYQLTALDARKEVAEHTIENWRTSVETIRALKEAGTPSVTEVAVQQNMAQMHFAQALLVDIQQNIFLLENTLNTLLARPYQPIEREDWLSIEMPEYLEVGLPAQLLANRPDLRQLEYQIRSDFELVNVAKTNFYPALRINAGAGLESVRIGDFLSPGSLFANIAGGLTQPILDRRQNKTQLEVSNLLYEQSILQYENAYLQAVQEVTDALTIAQKSDEKIVYQESQLEALDQAVEFSNELLNNGLANYLEVLRARDQVFTTELSLVDTRLRKVSAVVSLYKALGGGWNPGSLDAVQESVEEETRNQE